MFVKLTLSRCEVERSEIMYNWSFHTSGFVTPIIIDLLLCSSSEIRDTVTWLVLCDSHALTSPRSGRRPNYVDAG